MIVNASGLNKQLYRGTSIDASYQVSVHFGKVVLRGEDSNMKC